MKLTKIKQRNNILTYSHASVYCNTKCLHQRFSLYLADTYAIDKLSTINFEKLVHFVHNHCNTFVYSNKIKNQNDTPLFKVNSVTSKSIYGQINYNNKKIFLYKIFISFLLQEKVISLFKNYSTDKIKGHSKMFEVMIPSNTANKYTFTTNWYQNFKQRKKSYMKMDIEKETYNKICGIKIDLLKFISIMIENKMPKLINYLEEYSLNGVQTAINNLSITDKKATDYYQQLLVSCYMPFFELEQGDVSNIYAKVNEKTGRLYSNLTSISSVFYTAFTFEDENLIEIDITNSQPLLLANHLLEQNLITEDSNFLISSRNGTIYEDFAEHVGIDISSDKARKQFKEDFYTQVLFAKYNYIINSKMGKYLKIYDEQFYNILVNEKQTKGVSEFACELQRYEAAIILPIAIKYLKNYEFCLTKHDSIIVNNNKIAEDIKQYLENTLKCKVKIK